MDYVSLAGMLQNPLAGLALASLGIFVAGTIGMKLAKGRDGWIDTSSVLQGGGGSVFLGIVITGYMAANNMIS